MKKSTKILLTLAILMIVGGIISVSVGVAYYFKSYTITSLTFGEENGKVQSIELLDMPGAEIDIHSDNTVQELTVRYIDNKHKPRNIVEFDDGQLKITGNYDNTDLLSQLVDNEIEILVPYELDSISVQNSEYNGYGDIELEGLRVGSIDIQTTLGEIDVHNCNISGSANIVNSELEIDMTNSVIGGELIVRCDRIDIEKCDIKGSSTFNVGEYVVENNTFADVKILLEDCHHIDRRWILVNNKVGGNLIVENSSQINISGNANNSVQKMSVQGDFRYLGNNITLSEVTVGGNTVIKAGSCRADSTVSFGGSVELQVSFAGLDGSAITGNLNVKSADAELTNLNMSGNITVSGTDIKLFDNKCRGIVDIKGKSICSVGNAFDNAVTYVATEVQSERDKFGGTATVSGGELRLERAIVSSNLELYGESISVEIIGDATEYTLTQTDVNVVGVKDSIGSTDKRITVVGNTSNGMRPEDILSDISFVK